MSTELSGSTGNINSTPVAVPTPDAVESDSLNVPLIATVPVSVSPITAIVTPTTSTISATTPTVAAAGISELAALPVPTQTPEEIAKRNAINEKIRTENRERKKRWREANEDRNKDNDLRCRVNKRANKVFVPGQEEQKKQWIEEEFLKRQAKRKEKERKRRNGGEAETKSDTDVQMPSPAKQSLSLSEQLALHAQATAAAAAAAAAVTGTSLTSELLTSGLLLQHQHLQPTTSALNPANPHFDANTVKTALALNDLVKKTASGNGGHFDLAQLTGVLSDPNLQRQLQELEAAAAAVNSASPPTTSVPALTTAATQATPVSVMESVGTSTGQMLDTEYPMDAVLTLMQLNGSWKA